MAAALALQLTTQVGGVLPVDDSLSGRWPIAAAWCWPVGDAEHFGQPGAEGEPAFTVLRSVAWSHGRPTHQGADLGDGRTGEPVRAAGAGLVTLAFDGDNGNGYGGHVVLAHRLEDGGMVYTVYAHLLAGSLAVRAGDLVAVGDAIGRVGQTGRASAPHLHFEVRDPGSIEERWERARVVDPMAFVEDHLPTPDAPGVAADDAIDVGRTYARWAVESGLLASRLEPETPLTRTAWWRMLARAVAGGPDDSAGPPEALRDTLMDAGVLPEEEAGAPGDEAMAWSEVARDVKRLRDLGVRLAHGPLEAEAHETACETRFGQRSPAAHANALRRRDGEPRLADACVLLADVSGPRPETEYGRAPRQGSAHRASVKRTKHGKRSHATAHAKKPTPAKSKAKAKSKGKPAPSASAKPRSKR